MSRRPLQVVRPVEGPVLAGPERFSPANRRRLGAPALRTFLAIADLWGLSEEERLAILGYPTRSTYYGWCRTVRAHGDITPSADLLMRLSAVFGIHQALGILFAGEAEAVAFLRAPSTAPVFGGAPPLALATAGSQDGLMTLRRFLDAARGGLHMPPGPLDADARPYDATEIVIR